jgi:predicted metal-dependent hydrolase
MADYATMPPEPQLDEEERRLFARGVAEFNAGYYFECHDTLEEMWSGVRGPARDFFQGLIQVAVAFYHLSGGNLAGAESMLGRALKRFERYPDRYFGFDLAAHRRELEEWRERVARGSVEGLGPGQPPRWQFGESDGERRE